MFSHAQRWNYRPFVLSVAKSSITLRDEVSLGNLSYHLKTLWLFTASDFKTTLAPSILFALLHLCALPLFNLPPLAHSFLPRLASSLAWVWIHLLAFCVSNQRQPGSALEDRTNKSWRPLPAGRISSAGAAKLALIAHPLATLLSLPLGGLTQSLALTVCGYAYNDLGGADSSFVSRNVLNAAGFVSFISGAFEVLLSPWSLLYTNADGGGKLAGWLGLIAAVVASTIQTQDMHDQPGDSVRGRRTMPLVIGDAPARWAIALPVLVWGYLCPVVYWELSLGRAATFIGLAATIAYRTLRLRSVKQDRKTFLLWNVWVVNLYLLPLLRLWQDD